jgi:hypothetical protein
MKVNLFDTNFAHTADLIGCLTSTYIYPPTKLEWVSRQMEFDGITVFTDSMIFDPIVDQVKSKLKIAWLMEPPAIHPWAYADIINIENKFDYILTFEPNLLKRSNKYIKYIVGQSRVPEDLINFYPKTKKISLISSGKRMSNGHILRGDVVNALHSKHNFDLWGYAYKSFESKLEPLRDYQFSIAIMNSSMDNYFTEVLLDCFRLRTVPIFWGCPNIGEYFDINGMEIFNTIEELDNILSNLKPYEHYEKFIDINIEESRKYINTDDYIAEIFKQL